MSIQKQITASYDTLLKAVFSKRLLLMHPKNRYGNVLLAKLLQDESISCFYYALQTGDHQLKTFLEHLSAELSQQSEHSDFGKGFDKSLASSTVSSEILRSLAEQFAEKLNALNDKAYLLLLDNVDLTQGGNQVQPFVEQLLSLLAEHVHLVMNGRERPALPWLELLARDQALIFLNGQIEVDNFHDRDRQKPGKYDIEAFAFDRGRVLLRGKSVDDWEGKLPKLLFFFILNRGYISRTEILEAFWPDLSTDQAVNVFHVTKRRLHKALNLDVLVHQDDYYAINPAFNIYYDVMAFVEAVVKARNTTSKANEFWHEAATLYREPFLQGNQAAWIDASRTAFDAAFSEANAALSA